MTKKILITLDYESYFGTGCDFKSCGTSQYVAHEEFEVHCLAYKTRDMPRARAIPKPKVAAFMKKLRQFQDQIVLCGHNLYFDGYVAAYHYNFIPSFYFCSYSMGQALHAPYGPLNLDYLSKLYGYGGKVPDVLPKWRNKRWEEMSKEDRLELLRYNRVDAERTETLIFDMLPSMPIKELRLIDLTLRMFTQPMLVVNEQKAKNIIKAERAKQTKALNKAGVTKKQCTSELKFAKVLAERGFEVPMKWSSKKKKEIPALAQGDLPFKKMMESEDPELKPLIEARLISRSSINETRARSFLERAHSPVPIYLLYAAAHTLRWGGGDNLNPQNLPRDGRLRRCLEAPEGYRLVAVDAEQIEARDNATFSEQWDLVEDFAKGIDVYAKFASELYGFEVTAEDNFEERFVGKSCILGLGYQMGAYKLQLTLELGMNGPVVIISMEEAQRAVSTYRSKYRKIKQNWYTMQRLIPHMLPGGKETEYQGIVVQEGKVLMPNGLHLHYPGLDYTIHPEYQTPEFTYQLWHPKKKVYERRKLYGGAFTENVIQCRSRCMTAEHMLELSRWYKVVLMSHDEIVMCVPANKAKACLRDATEIMSIPPRWNEKCPLAAKGKITEFYTKDS